MVVGLINHAIKLLPPHRSRSRTPYDRAPCLASLSFSVTSPGCCRLPARTPPLPRGGSHRTLTTLTDPVRRCDASAACAILREPEQRSALPIAPHMATPSDLGGARQQAEATFAPSQYVANASHEPLSHRPDASMTVYQTTGPDARTTPILAADNITPALNPRSCATCRRRKVRCDKQMPCSNCRRGQIPCVFPAPGRAPRRPKDPNAPSRSGSHREAELVRRLRKLEGIVEELSEQVEVESAGRDVSIVNSPDGTVTPRTSISAHRHSSAGLFTRNISSASSSRPPDTPSDHSSEGGTRKEAHHKFGRLFRNEPSGPARYVSSAFWSKLNDEVSARILFFVYFFNMVIIIIVFLGSVRAVDFFPGLAD